jgi:hypothetical protein
MAKVFNVEQIRLNNILLTGNSNGELWYNNVRLATGGSAVPQDRKIELLDGLQFITNHPNTPVQYASEDTLATDLMLELMVDGATLGFTGTPAKVEILNGGVTFKKLNPLVAGPGLTWGNVHSTEGYPEAGMEVKVDDSSIEVDSDTVRVKALGITNGMLEGSINSEKFLQITGSNKVRGDAVGLDGSTLAGSTAGLKISDGGVGVNQIATAVAGNGLEKSSTSAINVNPHPSSGLSVNSTYVGIHELGVTNAMLAGSIENDKLLTISGASNGTIGGVYGEAITTYGNTLNVTSHGLHVAAGQITKKEIDSDSLGNGLTGGDNTIISVTPGSGIFVADGNVNIDKTGIWNSMIANNDPNNAEYGITEGKLAGGIPMSKTLLTAGDGLDLSSNDLTLDIHGTRPGLEIDSQKVRVDKTVVRADSSYGTAGTPEILSGHYSFKEDVLFLSGVTIDGDLEIRGDTTVTQSNEVEIGDSIIRLNAGYNGTTAPNAGFDIERGVDGGSNDIDHAWLFFDDDGTTTGAGGASNDADQWVAGVSSNGTSNLYRVETQEFNRSYSVEITSGVGVKLLDFGHTFATAPNVVASIQHTGKYSSSMPVGWVPDFMGCMVDKIYTTGVHVTFTANTNCSGYYLNVHASTGPVTNL